MKKEERWKGEGLEWEARRGDDGRTEKGQVEGKECRGIIRKEGMVEEIEKEVNLEKEGG